jgi:hypothetical protein
VKISFHKHFNVETFQAFNYYRYWKDLVKENLDNLCHNKLRRWLEIPPNGTPDIVLLAKTKTVIDVSPKHAQCQVSFRRQLKNSTNEDASSTRSTYSSTRSGCNIQYDRFNNCREVLKEIRDEKLDKVNKLVSQSIVVKALWQETLVSDVKQWHRTLNKLPKNSLLRRGFNELYMTLTSAEERDPRIYSIFVSVT